MANKIFVSPAEDNWKVKVIGVWAKTGIVKPNMKMINKRPLIVHLIS